MKNNSCKHKWEIIRKAIDDMSALFLNRKQIVVFLCKKCLKQKAIEIKNAEELLNIK